MDEQKINRLRKELIELRRKIANIKRNELVNFAIACGRIQAKRGKEDYYILPNRPPLSIPRHNKLNKFTVRNILDFLEEDLFYQEELEGNEKT